LVHGRDDPRDVRLNETPSSLSEDHNGNPAGRKILLEAEVFVRCNQDVKSGFFSFPQ